MTSDMLLWGAFVGLVTWIVVMSLIAAGYWLWESVRRLG